MPRTPVLLRRVLPPQHEYAWPTGADLEPGEDMVGWPELRATGRLVTGETQQRLAERIRAATFISSAISLAITREDRLADVNINTSPSCLTSVPRGAIKRLKITISVNGERELTRKRLCLLTWQHCGLHWLLSLSLWPPQGVETRCRSDTFRSCPVTFISCPVSSLMPVWTPASPKAK